MTKQQHDEYGVNTPWFSFNIAGYGNTTNETKDVVLVPMTEKKAEEYGLTELTCVTYYGYKEGCAGMDTMSRIIFGVFTLGNETTNGSTIYVPLTQKQGEEYGF